MNKKNNNRLFLIWLSILSVVLIFSLYLKLCDKLSNFWQLTIDIITMLAGGVFASAFVTILVELSNEKYLKQINFELRKIFIHNIHANMLWIIQNEMRNFRQIEIDFYTNENIRWAQKKDINCSFIKGIEFIKKKSEIIKKAQVDRDFIDIDNKIVYTQERLDKENKIFSNLYKTIDIYKSLNNEIEKLENNKATYLTNNTFENSEIQYLNDLKHIIEVLIKCAKHKNDDYIFEIKMQILDEFAEYFNKFNFSEKLKDFKISGVFFNKETYD